VKQEFKLNNFDLLRIFAASQVLVCHTVLHLHVFAPQWLMKLIYAFPGVPIFFVISGFLISLSYERSSGLKSYCRNRVLRIYPGLWCCILSTILVAALFGYSFASGQAVVAACTYLVGYLSWIAVERPFLRKKQQTISPTLVADKHVNRLASATG
jgi:peptidoglycan/LPS O-acetylase OafA/YrhL